MYQTLLLATSATHLQHGHRFKTPMWHNNILLFFSVLYRFVTTAFLFLLHNLTSPSIFICSVHFLAASIGPNFPTKGGILERYFAPPIPCRGMLAQCSFAFLGRVLLYLSTYLRTTWLQLILVLQIRTRGQLYTITCITFYSDI